MSRRCAREARRSSRQGTPNSHAALPRHLATLAPPSIQPLLLACFCSALLSQNRSSIPEIKHTHYTHTTLPLAHDLCKATVGTCTFDSRSHGQGQQAAAHDELPARCPLGIRVNKHKPIKMICMCLTVPPAWAHHSINDRCLEHPRATHARRHPTALISLSWTIVLAHVGSREINSPFG